MPSLRCSNCHKLYHGPVCYRPAWWHLPLLKGAIVLGAIAIILGIIAIVRAE